MADAALYRHIVDVLLAEHEKSEPPSPRDEPTARMLAVTWGIYCQVHRFARAAVLLGDNGMGQEGVVLVRTMLEHTVVLHWIIERGDDGVDAMLANQSKQMKSWLQNAKNTSLTVPQAIAATYPSVIDYYLRDGRDRLQAALESLTAVLRTSMRIGSAAAVPEGPARSPSGPLQPAETAGTLAALHAALNEHDPHFSYDYSVDSARPEVPDQPGLVAAVQDGDGKRWVTFKVFARCAESLVERPVPLSLTITADPGSDLHRDIEVFDKYGTPFTAPTGTADAKIDLPGGLGGAITGGSVRLEPAASTRTAGHDIRLQVVDPADEIIAETIVHMEPPTTGPSRRGVRGHGTEQHGIFAFEVLTDLDAQTVSYALRPGDLTGRPPGSALAGLRLLREFRYPNGLRVAAPFGPATHRPEPIPEGTEPATGIIVDIVEALAALQDHTTAQILIPDLAKLTHGEARRILHAAELIRGAAISAPWEGFVVHLRPGASPPTEDIFSGLLYQELSISVGTIEVSLGYRQVHLPAARADPGSLTRHDDHHDIRIVPVGGAQAVIRYSPGKPPSG